MKITAKKLCFSIIFIFLNVLNAGNYDFSNDYEYQKILLENNVLGKDWTVQEKFEIPKQLLKFATAKSDILDATKLNLEEGYLVPRIVLEFQKEGKFIFLWEKNNTKVGEISGDWKIENSMLMLTLTKNYPAPYLKGTQFRYKILGTDKLKTILLFKGGKYPLVTKIIETSSSPTYDLEKVVIAMEQTLVSKHYPKIMKSKEKQLKEQILNAKAKSMVTDIDANSTTDTDIATDTEQK